MIRPTPPLEVAHRRRNQPAPPHVVAEALREPDRDPARPWLRLLTDEQRPVVLASDAGDVVLWSSLWPRHPRALIRFELPWDTDHSGTDLCWRLFLDAPGPDAGHVAHLRKRINRLINADLRHTFGQ